MAMVAVVREGCRWLRTRIWK